MIAAAETTPGESEALWADAGPLAWVSWAGDPTQVEFAEYTDPRGASTCNGASSGANGSQDR